MGEESRHRSVSGFSDALLQRHVESHLHLCYTRDVNDHVNDHGEKRKTSITIRDVAEQAGVSRQTVSRAINNKGEITFANIVTPTCQNLRNIERDIKAYTEKIVGIPREKLVLEIEKLIRAYDPCFSCSTHFLKVKWVSR